MDAEAAQSKPASRPRMLWLDANRVCAALGVVLIHSTTDASGQPFSSVSVEQRIGPSLLRAVSELSGSEIFLVFSLFLLAAKLERKPMPYGKLLREQARKILVPFLAWTVFYAFFRLFKAEQFGYSAAIVEQLRQPASWAGYVVLGSAQYHLHFMPTLFTLVVLSPLLMGALRFPWLGFGCIGFLCALETIQGFLWGNVPDPTVRYYIDQFAKNLCFSGYGLAGVAIYGLWKQRMNEADARVFFRTMLLITGVAFVGTLPYIVGIIKTGQWGARPGASFYAHYLMPVLVFLCFFAAQHLKWPERFAWFAPFTLGLYLVHPIVIDVFDVVSLRSGITLGPTLTVVTKFMFASAGAFVITYALSRVPRLSWLVGLEQSKPALPASQVGPVATGAA